MDDRIDQIVERIRQAKSLVILTHARPDGDGLGSVAALAGAARSAGKQAAMFVPDKVPDRYAFLFPDEKPYRETDFERLADAADLVVIVDTCAFTQLDGLEPALRARRDKIIVIDHHATRDDIGSVQWLDTSAAAGGVMVAEVIEALGWWTENRGQAPFSKGENGASPHFQVATALATAITSDTGWLRFANTDSRCLSVMGRLLDAGVRPDRLYARLFQCDRPERLRLTARMLSTLELHCGGQLAVMCIRKADFEASGAMLEETENLINEALRIGTVESVVLLVEFGDLVRTSLRSRDAIDVAAIAKRFGGGGHSRAAGLRSTVAIEELKGELVRAFEGEFLKRVGGA